MIFTKRDRELLEDLIEENKELRKTINVMRSELTRFKNDVRSLLNREIKRNHENFLRKIENALNIESDEGL